MNNRNPRNRSNEGKKMKAWQELHLGEEALGGLSAGIVGTVIGYPLDVVKTRSKFHFMNRFLCLTSQGVSSNLLLESIIVHSANWRWRHEPIHSVGRPRDREDRGDSRSLQGYRATSNILINS